MSRESAIVYGRDSLGIHRPRHSIPSKGNSLVAIMNVAT